MTDRSKLLSVSMFFRLKQQIHSKQDYKYVCQKRSQKLLEEYREPRSSGKSSEEQI